MDWPENQSKRKIQSETVCPYQRCLWRKEWDCEIQTEDNVPRAGIIYYDIRFITYLKEAEIKIMVNIEAQRSSGHSKLRYHLENRIICYFAWMISTQKQTEFFHSDIDVGITYNLWTNRLARNIKGLFLTFCFIFEDDLFLLIEF